MPVFLRCTLCTDMVCVCVHCVVITYCYKIKRTCKILIALKCWDTDTIPTMNRREKFNSAAQCPIMLAFDTRGVGRGGG